jgi:hypothetical protein
MDGVQLGAESDEPAGAGRADADPDAGCAADGNGWIAGELDFWRYPPLPPKLRKVFIADTLALYLSCMLPF